MISLDIRVTKPSLYSSIFSHRFIILLPLKFLQGLFSLGYDCFELRECHSPLEKVFVSV